MLVFQLKSLRQLFQEQIKNNIQVYKNFWAYTMVICDFWRVLVKIT
jgi:endonuclease III-like uncharacterized protein